MTTTTPESNSDYAGITNNKVEIFLAHAIQLERDAARRYEELSAAMGTEGNRDLKEFFDRMAYYSRMHLTQAAKRGGFRELPVIAPEDFEWPEGTSPETAGWAGVDAQMDRRAALDLANAAGMPTMPRWQQPAPMPNCARSRPSLPPKKRNMCRSWKS
jgi:hypothetical protein